MNIVIFGANGQTGRLLTRRVLDAGHSAVAVTRRPDDFPIGHPALVVVGADARDPEPLVDIVYGADAVVSTLGVPFTREAVDTYSLGTANIVAAMHDTGARRLVVVSSTGAYPAPGRSGAPFALRLIEPVITRTIGKTVYDDIRRMETVVRGSDLDWTIVRPSGLFDSPSEGWGHLPLAGESGATRELAQATDYLSGEVDPVGAFTARIDLADYLVKLATGRATGDTVTVSTLTDTPTMWQMVRREAFKSA
jgi:nucleoside-diphosphate-sugar epimerase